MVLFETTTITVANIVFILVFFLTVGSKRKNKNEKTREQGTFIPFKSGESNFVLVMTMEFSPSRHNGVVTTLLRRRYLTSLLRYHIVAMETSDDVAKTTSLQRLTRRRQNEMLQRRHSCNFVWPFHRSYMETLERRQIATPQRRCSNVPVSTGKQI